MTMRSDIIKLCGKPVVGIELGVAEGVFSQQVLQHQAVAEWYAVDMWAGDRGHGMAQFHSASKKIEPFPQATVIRSKFADVVDRFEDEYFDFVFFDAHLTEEQLFFELSAWYPKIKTGGLVIGHDWHMPETSSAVFKFRDMNNITNRLSSYDCTFIWKK